MHVSSDSGSLTLREHEGGVEIVDGDERTHLPGVGGQSATVLVDGPVLEVFFGTLSYAIGSSSDLAVTVVDRVDAERLR